ncbi:MAG: pre-peptidase C-terminal domain-containing protein [Polyangiaceae bacterium]
MLGLAASVVAVGCGDDSTGGGGSGATGGSGASGGAGATGGQGGSGTPTTTTTTTTTSTGMTGDGNDTIATATPMDAANGAFQGSGDLDPAQTDVDFFSFDGTAGPILIATDAKPDADPFADGYIDLVVTLFDANGNQIAQNDDPFPRFTQDSEIYTILPTDGKYFVKVEEFCEFAGAVTGCDQAYFDAITETAFAVSAIPLDPAQNSVVEETNEPNDAVANATPMEYEPVSGMAGSYYLSVAYGDYMDQTDKDSIAFTIPADEAVDVGTRLSASFALPAPGTDGNGSARNPGVIEILDATGTTVLSRFDMSSEPNDPNRVELSVPVIPGGTYLFRNTAGPAAAGGSMPFYYVLHSTRNGNPLETAEATNNVQATAEALTQASGVQSYFVEGDLGAGDVDHFLLDVLDAKISITCAGARMGSGLQNLKATVLNASNSMVIGSASESISTDLLLQDAAVNGATQVVVKLEKSGQDATNTGTAYRCGFHFNP